MTNKIQVRLEDGTIGVPDKFIIYGIEYNSHYEAQQAGKKEVFKQLDIWLDTNTYLLSGERDKLLTYISKIDCTNLHVLINLLKNLLELNNK